MNLRYSITMLSIAALLLSPSDLRARELADKAVTTDGKRPLGEVNLAIKLGAPFCDNAILQREMDAPVWGWSKPGTKITVEFAGQKKTALTGKDGKWLLKLAPLKANVEPQEMVISDSAGNKVTLKNILVGEVWICSGQSNMQYGWGSKSELHHNWGSVPELAALAPTAKAKPIRHYLVPTFVSLEPEKRCGGEWSTDVSGSAVAFGLSYYLNQKLNVPVGVIVTCWGSSSIEGWMPLDMTAQLPHFKTMIKKFDANDKAAVLELIEQQKTSGCVAGPWQGNKEVWVRTRPNLLYNAMLHPLVPYACRGMVWYQGEANAAQPGQYAVSLPLWVKRLRAAWGRDDFHFLIVMLPGYGKDNGWPGAKSWAWFREVQMGVLKEPHTSVANTIDLGGENNIHPADKAPICERLALLACRDVYGQKTVAQGPVFKGSCVKGNRIAIEFNNAEGLKTTDGAAPGGFWLAGSDKTWYPARASIKGNKVEVEADGLASPVYVRYAFSSKPAVNLVNSDNLPAYPFRTDDWPQ